MVNTNGVTAIIDREDMNRANLCFVLVKLPIIAFHYFQFSIPRESSSLIV